MSTKILRAGLLATTLGAVALLPAATIATLVSVDAAHAKGGNGGNGNGGGGRSSEARGGGDKAERGGGRASGAGRTTGNKGQSQRSGASGQSQRGAESGGGGNGAARSASVRSAPETSIAPARRPERAVVDGGLHPSELGNMNGALNANMNAILAHVRNGNTNGPVGQMAALAVASATAAQAEELLASEEGLTYQLFQSVVEGAGYDNLDDYLESGDTDATIDAALEAFEGFDKSTYEEVLAAEEAEDGLLSAKQSILAYWNKNPDSAPEIDPVLEQPLLDDLVGRFAGYEDEIAAALAESGAGANETDDEQVECEDVEGCEAANEDEVAAVE